MMVVVVARLTYTIIFNFTQYSVPKPFAKHFCRKLTGEKCSSHTFIHLHIISWTMYISTCKYRFVWALNFQCKNCSRTQLWKEIRRSFIFESFVCQSILQKKYNILNSVCNVTVFRFVGKRKNFQNIGIFCVEGIYFYFRQRYVNTELRSCTVFSPFVRNREWGNCCSFFFCWHYQYQLYTVCCMNVNVFSCVLLAKAYNFNHNMRAHINAGIKLPLNWYYWH